MPTADPARHEWTAVPSVGVLVYARAWSGSPTRAPLILVAGLGVSSRYWARLGRRLGGRYAVLAPDLPGFGRTPPSPGAPWPAAPSAREQADQLLAWMDARGIGRAVLCGHSVGCQTVVDLATRFPDRAERIILAAPPFEPGRRSLAVSLARLAIGPLFEVPSLPFLLAVDYASSGPARAIGQALRTMNYPMEQRLPLIAVPTLVIHGALDPLVSRRWSERVAALVPGAKSVVVEQVGHAMHYSAAAVTAGVVDAFLENALDGPTAVPRDDASRDPVGPPQPISPAARSLVNGLFAAVMAGLARRRPSRSRRAMTAIAVARIAADACRLPPITGASLDLLCGAGLLVTAALRPASTADRRIAVVSGIGLISLAALTAKPTGPARQVR